MNQGCSSICHQAELFSGWAWASPSSQECVWCDLRAAWLRFPESSGRSLAHVPKEGRRPSNAKQILSAQLLLQELLGEEVVALCSQLVTGQNAPLPEETKTEGTKAEGTNVEGTKVEGTCLSVLRSSKLFVFPAFMILFSKFPVAGATRRGPCED